MIKIAHLYYDLLNLYGEQGNVLALRDAFRNQNVETEVDLYSIKDEIDFKDYDIVYLGSGSKESLLLAASDIIRLKRKLQNYIESGKYLIATGSSYLLFGKYIIANDKEIEGLNIFPFYAKESERVICHSFMRLDDDTSPIIGFQNRSFIVQIDDNHLFNVISGFADNQKSSYEGYHYKNFYGTHLIGPLLIRNPKLTEKIVKNVIDANDLKYHQDENTPSFKAYREYLKNFYEQS